MAVIRNGGFRTTHDIDILTTQTGWAAVRKSLEGEFKTSKESAEDINLGIPVDVLFPGNDWDIVIPLPEQDKVWEYDDELGGYLYSLISE